MQSFGEVKYSLYFVNLVKLGSYLSLTVFNIGLSDFHATETEPKS